MRVIFRDKEADCRAENRAEAHFVSCGPTAGDVGVVPLDKFDWVFHG